MVPSETEYAPQMVQDPSEKNQTPMALGRSTKSSL